jgi:hypothetical protein
MVLLSDRKTRKEIGAKERKFILKHNHPDIVAQNLILLYEELQ